VEQSQKIWEASKLRERALQDKEDENAAFVRELRKEHEKKIQQLLEDDSGYTQQLWEANKLNERALLAREDECAANIRELRKEHENILMEKDDSYLKEVRDFKKKSEQTLRNLEESYLKQLRDAKKKEQALIGKVDVLVKQLKDVLMRDSLSEINLDNMIQKKEEEFDERTNMILCKKDEEFEKKVTALEIEIKRFEAEINQLRKEKKEASVEKKNAKEIERKLLECKRDLDQQQRKHTSEIKQLNTSLELQKSKEGRLQSHIESLEKQISDMVNDYESMMQDAFYDNM